jgi:hypothetical protein
MKECKNPDIVKENPKEDDPIKKSQFLSNNNVGEQVALASPISCENCSMTGGKWSWHNYLYAVDRATAKKGVVHRC